MKGRQVGGLAWQVDSLRPRLASWRSGSAWSAVLRTVAAGRVVAASAATSAFAWRPPSVARS